MKLAIVGSRRFSNPTLVRAYVRRLPRHYAIVSGACRDSPDEWAAEEARKLGMKVIEFPVDTRGLPSDPMARRIEYARRAYARNALIAEECDGLVAFWDSVSGGTKNAMDHAERLGKPVVVYDPEGRRDVRSRGHRPCDADPVRQVREDLVAPRLPFDD